MKLTKAQTNAVKDKLDLDVIDETQQIQKELENALGEHSFFVSEKGLFVFKENEKPGDTVKTARLMIVAAWAGEDKKQLASIEPPKEIDIQLDLDDGTIVGGK